MEALWMAEVRYFDEESCCVMYILQSEFLCVTELIERVEASMDEELSNIACEDSIGGISRESLSKCLRG